MCKEIDTESGGRLTFPVAQEGQDRTGQDAASIIFCLTPTVLHISTAEILIEYKGHQRYRQEGRVVHGERLEK